MTQSERSEITLRCADLTFLRSIVDTIAEKNSIQSINIAEQLVNKSNNANNSGKTKEKIKETTESNESNNSNIEDKGVIIYLKMTLYDGTLAQWMHQQVNEMDVSTIIEIVRQIISAVNYIHSMKVTHHDIKPENIYYLNSSQRFSVHLGDFGLSCSPYNTNHLAVGTPMYAALEQYQGECTPKSDIYSVGVIFLQLITSPSLTPIEFYPILKRFKDGDIPESLTIEKQKLAYLALRMIKSNPDERPRARQVLIILEAMGSTPEEN